MLLQRQLSSRLAYSSNTNLDVCPNELSLCPEGKSSWLAGEDRVGFSLASLKETRFEINLSCPMRDFFLEFWVNHTAFKKVLLYAKPRTPAKCQWILAQQASSNPDKSVLTWLWISIPATICKDCSATLGCLT